MAPALHSPDGQAMRSRPWKKHKTEGRLPPDELLADVPGRSPQCGLNHDGSYGTLKKWVNTRNPAWPNKRNQQRLVIYPIT
jgi:hypothetical protein